MRRDGLRGKPQFNWFYVRGLYAVMTISSLPGLFRGYFATVGSRLLGSPAYFCTYELLRLGVGIASIHCISYAVFRREFVERNEGQLFSRHYIVSGSFAGIAFWAVSFPVDSLKTRMQVLIDAGGRTCLPQHTGGVDSAQRSKQQIFVEA